MRRQFARMTVPVICAVFVFGTPYLSCAPTSIYRSPGGSLQFDLDLDYRYDVYVDRTGGDSAVTYFIGERKFILMRVKFRVRPRRGVVVACDSTRRLVLFEAATVIEPDAAEWCPEALTLLDLRINTHTGTTSSGPLAEMPGGFIVVRLPQDVFGWIRVEIEEGVGQSYEQSCGLSNVVGQHF